MTDEYDDAVARSLQPATTNPAIAARAGLFFAADTNPDAYAEARRVARRTGVPVDTVLALPAEMKRQDAVGRIDFDTLAETAPATAALLADDALAKMAHDDVENLGQIERKLRQLGGGLVEGVGMATSGTGRLLDVAQRSLAGWAGLLLPTPRAGGSPTLESLAGPLIGDDWRGAGQLAKRFAREDVMVPAAQRTFSDQVAAGLGQIAGQIAMLPLTRGAGLFAQGADAIGEKIDADPAPQWKKDLATLGGSAVTGVTEKWALDRILGPLAAPIKNQIAALLARIGVAAAAEGGQEFAENVLHDVIRQVATNPDAPIDLGQSVGEGEVGATVGGIVRAIVEAGLHVKVRGDRQAQDARRAEQTAEFLDNANKLAASSKLLARDPQTFEQFVAQAAESGPVQQVFIDAQTLMQSGVAEQVAAVSPAVASQLATAAQTGGQIAIPVEEYAARIAPTEYAQSLLDHLKVEPEGFSRAEAQEFMQSHAEELQAEVERTLAEKQGDDTFKASAEAVRAEVKAQLDTAARFTPQVNDAYSAMVGNFYAVTAAKLGVTPEELFKRYPLKVGAERIDGPQFAQGGLRIVDVFGNGSRVDHFDDAKGLMYSAQKFPTGTRWTVFETFPAEEGGDQILGEMFKYKSLEEAQSAVRGLRISATQKSKNAAKYGAIPNLWKGEEKKVAKALIDAGVSIERFTSSTQSRSKYLYLESGLKVRLADHALPDHYDQPDIDYRYGGDIKALVEDVKNAEEGAPTPDSNELGSQALNNQGGMRFNAEKVGAGETVLNQSAFHGSPYKFDKFSLEHLGRGEGNQAYGWGLYFAGKKGIAEHYRQMLSKRPGQHLLETKDGKPIKPHKGKQQSAHDYLFGARTFDGAIAELRQSTYAKLYPKDAEQVEAVIAKWRDEGVKFVERGQLYEVKIPEDDEYLLWDRPLEEQSEKVRRALSEVASKYGYDYTALPAPGGDGWGQTAGKVAPVRGSDIYLNLTRDINVDGINGARRPDQAASEMLNEAGIKGIKYLDGTSRSAGDGSYNFVIFDDSAVEILNTYYQSKGEAARGSFNPASLSITLLKGADLSTFLHESGHFFLEVQADIAAKLQQEAEIFGMDTLKPGERQILADTDALLRWFKVRDLAEWQSLDFEEKRVHHEQFARSFEAYLFEGKAPSIELQGLFQRFRAWLLHVYKSLKSLDVELNDEVRGVFDRMLATNEQITLAEQGRSMMPLFTSPEQAGMTPEEFAAYQALGVDATAEAIEDLQARGLRDMRWLHNARGRAIKRLQKEAAARRAEVQMDVRREVMSQPVYRAWQFLTGKMTADDAVDNPQPPKSDPDTLDETIDSLFVAIAKLGGIDKGETLGTWGIDPADKPASGVFGKPVWRLNGEGRSLDSMREALSQYGWRFDTLQEFEEAFGRELRGDPVYSSRYAPEQFAVGRPGDQVANPAGLTAGRLDLDSLAEIGLPVELVNHLKALRMTAKQGGLHPDLVAEWFGFTSGDEMARTLAAAEAPREEIEALTDVRMLEQFGELSSPDAIARAADKAIHNDARARFVATEANALAKATGQRKVLASAAKEFARAMIARLKVRDIKPGQYANAEVRAAKAAEKASKSGDLATAAAEKRNQLIQNYATRAAYDAQEEVDKGLRYLKKFEGDIKTLDADYADQISNLLERFDLRKGQSNKAVDKRTALAEWIKAQREAGLEPDIPPELENEAFRTSYKNLTVEEFQGLVDTVRQIEHLGRLKHKLLTAADQRAYEAVRDEIAASIHEHAQGREADTRTPTTNMGRAVQGLKRFWAAHIKAATWARVMDGGSDGGPMWEYFIREANAAGDLETMMRAEATGKLSEILAPVFALGRMGGAGQFFPSIGRSLNREACIALALNIGNEGNLQRLLDGEGWTEAQIAPVLQTLTPQERAAVQAVWDHFESYRPQIAAKERRIYGKEPEWVAPGTALAEALGLRGGYYPIKYDPAASQRAEEHADAESAKRQLQGAYTTATTRRSFTKSRAEEVKGRPLLYTLSGLYSGVNDVIHDLAWHEWLIDANRLLRSHTIDAAIREHYGPEAKQQFKTWVQDVAEGEKGADAAVDLALSRLRQGVSAAGLGFNVMSALIQPLGITQSITRVGAPWVARGVRKYISNPVGLTRTINGMSSFMENRARTRFRELNELRNQVQDQSAFNEYVGRYAFFLMMRCQQMVDVPTWWGAYEKAIAGGNEEARAIALADQAVIDAQGGGQTKDLSAIERGGPAQRLFTVFYTFMNTALNLGVAQTMSANTPAKRAKLAVDYAMLYVVPAVLGYFIKNAFTPGDSGDDDPEKIAKKLLANQIDYLMGLMVVVREFGEAAKIVSGANDMGRGYTGPAGLRLVADTVALAKQAHQGEFDTAFRKAAINVIGDLFGLPSAQVNRTITGTEALVEGKTGNPAAVVFGFQEPR